MVLAAFAAAIGLRAGWRHAHLRGPLGRRAGHALPGIAAAALVLLLQSVSVGASLSGAVLALAVGGTTLLVLVLARSA